MGVKAIDASYSPHSRRFLGRLRAYAIVLKGEAVAGDKPTVPGGPILPSEDDDRRSVEGHPKRVAHLGRERAPA